MENFSIVIPFYNGYDSIDRLIRSIPRKFPVIIVDDQSDEPLTQKSIDKRWEHPEGNDIKVIRMARKGYFAGAVNRGIQECETDVLVLNQDTWFDDDGFFQTIESLRREYAFFGERIRGDHPAFGDLGYVHGVCMFLRRDAIRVVGLLNEKDFPLWGATAEWQWRAARKNFKILPIEKIQGFHHERPAGERYGKSIKSLLKKEPQNEKLLVRTPPLLSVVVPVYNYGRYLMDCISSLIGGTTSIGEMPGQTIQDFEVVIVDDASTDDSMEYIKQVTSIEKGIRSYHLQRNVGTARALNYAIERSYGKYITFLSADDMREPDSLEKLIEACEKNPHSFAYDDVWLVNKAGRVKKWQVEEYDFEKLIWKNQIPAGILYPKQAWVDVGGYPAIMNDGREDWAFNVALGVRGWCGVHVQNYGYLYRREGQNRTERNTTQSHRERFLEKVMSLFPDIYKGKRPMACCGKGSNTKKNVGVNSVLSARSMSMAMNGAAPIGSQGMELIEYRGEQMNFTISGDTTNAKYTFGKDRQKGWVDRRDLGTREGKMGFLSKRGADGNWLYRVASSNGTAVAEPEPVAVMEVVEEVSKPMVEGVGEASGTLTPRIAAKTATPTPNPSEMTVEQIKALAEDNLTREQWEEMYKLEMAGRNRKGGVAFIEEVLANWGTSE
jgi:glycosyltransferase involved in cell wall biosynthesis